MKNIGDRPGRVLVIIMPGELSNFFEEIDAKSKEDELGPEKIMEIVKRYDVDFVQPKHSLLSVYFLEVKNENRPTKSDLV